MVRNGPLNRILQVLLVESTELPRVLERGRCQERRHPYQPVRLGPHVPITKRNHVMLDRVLTQERARRGYLVSFGCSDSIELDASIVGESTDVVAAANVA